MAWTLATRWEREFPLYSFQSALSSRANWECLSPHTHRHTVVSFDLFVSRQAISRLSVMPRRSHLTVRTAEFLPRTFCVTMSVHPPSPITRTIQDNPSFLSFFTIASMRTLRTFGRHPRGHCSTKLWRQKWVAPDTSGSMMAKPQNWNNVGVRLRILACWTQLRPLPWSRWERDRPTETHDIRILDTLLGHPDCVQTFWTYNRRACAFPRAQCMSIIHALCEPWHPELSDTSDGQIATLS